MLEHALRYASRGWHVFPLCAGTKKPFPGSNGFKEATTEEATIRAWWSTTPTANIGFVPGLSGLIALDVDPRSNPDPEIVARLLSSPTMRVNTPSGGFHLYYDAQGKTYGNKKLCQGIDVRSSNGYTVLPPSIIDYREHDDVMRWGEYV